MDIMVENDSIHCICTERYTDEFDTDSDNDHCQSVASEEAAIKKHVPQSPSSVDSTFDLYCDKSDVSSTGTSIHIDKLEENNNDSINDTCNTTLDNDNSSNCTADGEQYTFSTKVKDEASQICALVSSLNYNAVCTNLHKNRHAENRVELTLWDLLPFKRPKAKWFPRLANAHDNSMQHKNVIENADAMKHKGNQLSNVTSLGRNVSMSDSTHNNNSRNSHSMFDDYLHYLKFMQVNKKMKLDRGGPIFDVSTRNKIRKRFLTSHGKNLKRNDVLPLNKNCIQKVSTVDEDCENNPTNDCSDMKEETINSIDSLSSKSSSTTDINLQALSTNVSLNETEHCNTEFSKTIIHSVVKTATELQGVVENMSLRATLRDHDSSSSVHKGIPDTARTKQTTLTSAQARTNKLSYDNALPLNSTNTDILLYKAVPNTLKRPIPNGTLFRTLHQVESNSGSYGPSTPATAGLKCAGARKKEVTKRSVPESFKDLKEGNDTLRAKFQDIYEKLKDIFPDVNKGYLREICKHYFNEGTFQLQEIVDNILQDMEVQMHKTDTNPGSQKAKKDTDDYFTYLSGVFPEADSTYLKKVLVRLHDNPDAISEFIKAQWENPTYPTKEEKIKRTSITQQQKQYTVAFDVKRFLQIFPDPCTYFENPQRKCTENPDAIEFLKSHFNQLKSSSLTRMYQKCNYHLTLTVRELEYMLPNRDSARNNCSWERTPSEDIPLLQECAFIKHKHDIQNYLHELREKEAKELEKLKKRKELFECQCCYNDECMPSKCSTCNDGHIFCNECIIKGLELKLAQGDTSTSCFLNCNAEFSFSMLQKVLPPMQFSSLISKRQDAEVKAADVEGLVSCPFCHFASIPPPDDKVFKCFNPDCMKKSCRLCRQLNHVPLKCNEKSDKARLFLEEKMTEAFVRKCYKCGRPYIKEFGCNKITCTCGAMMCYLCDIPVNGYEHFERGNCPLHSNDYLINSNTIKAVAKKAVEFIQAKDPHIKIDPNGLLQDLPDNDYQNAVVSVRVNKVANFDTNK